MKIVSTGSTLSSPEFHQKKRKAKKRKLILWSIWIVALLTLLIFLARMEQFRISVVDVAGANVVPKEMVLAVVEDAISGYYFWVIPRDNALIYPRHLVRNMLERKFPRFSLVNLSLSGLKTLEVNVIEREPFALYCESALRPEDAAACYFLDDTGFIFDQAPSFSGTVYFIYATETPLEEPLGKQYLSDTEFKPLARFISQLAELGIQPLALETSQDEFRLILPHDARIILRRSSDLDIIYTNLEVFLNNDDIKKQGDFLEKLNLLDLRTENKIRWTFK